MELAHFSVPKEDLGIFKRALHGARLDWKHSNIRSTQSTRLKKLKDLVRKTHYKNLGIYFYNTKYPLIGFPVSISFSVKRSMLIRRRKF